MKRQKNSRTTGQNGQKYGTKNKAEIFGITLEKQFRLNIKDEVDLEEEIDKTNRGQAWQQQYEEQFRSTITEEIQEIKRGLITKN